MIYNFDACPDRRASESVKWRQYPEDVLPLWVADMDFVSPEPVRRALLARVEHGIFGYPEESEALREVIAARLAERYGWAVEPGEIVFQPGVIRGFNRACHMVTERGGGVLVQTPVYYPILWAPGNAGLARQEAGLTCRADGSYTIDWEAFEAAITPETRLLILCNPHNPVGRVLRQDELARMAEICLRHDVLICSDEIHCDLLFPGHNHTPIASLDAEVAARTITLMAPSKTFNIAGLDCAFAVVQNASLRRRYLHAHRGLISGVNVLGWTAALAAYRDGQEWLAQVLAYLQANRDFLADFVRKELPGIQMSPLEGTYLAWLDCRSLPIEGSPYEFFLKQARVALNDGALFGHGGEGFVRLNLGCPRSTLVQALERMKAAISR
ncbi:MAG: MalY/PatB family protein [Chloroflexota bacterium]